MKKEDNSEQGFAFEHYIIIPTNCGTYSLWLQFVNLLIGVN